MQSWSSRIKEYNNIEICKGVEIDKSVYEEKENRLKTLIIKGIITYCLSVGGAGIYLSSFACEYSELTVHIVGIITAILCALLYYSALTENVGYIVYFLVFAGAAYLLKEYINTGFYAIVNDTMSYAMIYLKLEGVQHYTERMSDRYFSITVTACFYVMLSNIIVNNYISRRARYLIATIIVSFINIVPLFFGLEPDMIYVLLYFSGIFMAYFLKSGKHYRLYRRNSKYYHSEKGLSYGINSKVLRQASIVAVIIIFAFVNIISAIVPKQGYSAKGNNKYKQQAVDVAETLFTLGFMGLFNRYENNGGLSTGRLGGVSSIHLDYKTDIKIKYAPYSYEPIYLKDFVGGRYIPVENRWEMDKTYRTPEGENHGEVEALKKRFLLGKEYSAKAKIEVTNVDANAGIYLPYYSDDTNTIAYYQAPVTYEFYPLFREVGISPDNIPIDPEYRYVPDEIKDELIEFCEQRGFHGSDEEIIQQIEDYFQAEIPYTIKPGATPRGTDFILYFLLYNKKGYCAHYASATAMILRTMGIPSRYCEGYVVSYDQATRDGELAEDSAYEDYYEGYSAIGETAPIEVEVTDADAHAWVEAYIEGRGWVLVDATPAGEEEDIIDFWSQFSRDDIGKDKEDEETANFGGFKIKDSFIQKIAIVLLYIVIVAFLVFMYIYIKPFVVYNIEYKRAGINDKLIMKYMRYVRKLQKKDKEFKKAINYEDQLDYLVQSGKMTCTKDNRERLLEILKIAGFSNKKITNDDFTFAENILYSKR
ncbi:transglutaminase-like domain-containing protein [Eubacterium ruminantium]|uniref:transglutaminase-like domain-containing protein n=1 Tax=Eubacterium ruminantium TaxID=42322 RepID=UPI0015692E0A|nr:transglutaminase-like domain-containing protein [Eubacterium ruminantium]